MFHLPIFINIRHPQRFPHPHSHRHRFLHRLHPGLSLDYQLLYSAVVIVRSQILHLRYSLSQLHRTHPPILRTHQPPQIDLENLLERSLNMTGKFSAQLTVDLALKSLGANFA
jgi:hypothetical protein